ncbi:MAG: phosphate acetyltransferase [Bacteroides sp.]|nr:phosphate acetyltransferase [Bacteroides sp.]
MDLISEIVERAKSNRQRIVLPEGTEERTLKAANQILTDGVADLIILGDPAEIIKKAVELGLGNIGKATIMDPENHVKKEEYAQLLFEIRKEKGMTIEKARELVLDPLYLGCLIIKNGDADGQLAGAQNTTGNVLRPALQIIKTLPGINYVSGAMLLLTKAPNYGKNGLLVMGDVAVTPVPTPEQLAQIAVCTAYTARDVAGIEVPKVAMLSFSTKGSAKHEVVDRVIEAVKLAHKMDPTLMIDGEMQADAALVPSIGASKAPGSEIAGQANVLIVPSLEVGNIAYKLVERLGHADVVGPILQGMAKPVNDLSRGCSVDDIYKMVAITANQAIAAKNN